MPLDLDYIAMACYWWEVQGGGGGGHIDSKINNLKGILR